MSVLQSVYLNEAPGNVRCHQHDDGHVHICAGDNPAHCTITIVPVQIPALIAFLQSCTPAAPAEATR